MLKKIAGPLALLAFAAMATPAQATSDEVPAATYGPYCPSHIAGDREYDGHGPRVESSIELFRASGNRAINVRFLMHQRETVGDWTECELEQTETLTTAPGNATYTRVWMPVNDTFQWVNLGDAPLIDSVEVNYTDTDWDPDTFTRPDWFARSVTMVGDTRNDDVGRCTADDASYTARLDSLFFWYE